MITTGNLYDFNWKLLNSNGLVKYYTRHRNCRFDADRVYIDERNLSDGRFRGTDSTEYQAVVGLGMLELFQSELYKGNFPINIANIGDELYCLKTC